MQTKRKRTPLTNVEFVNSPLEWPRWPSLPMVSLKREGWEKNYLGLMMAEERPPYVVYLTTYHEIEANNTKPFTWKQALDKVEKETYETAEAMLQEWRID